VYGTVRDAPDPLLQSGHHSREDFAMTENLDPALAASADLPLPPSPLVEELPGGLRIPMRARRVGCTIGFLTVWLMGWSVGECLVANDFFFGTESLASRLLLLVWLLPWTAFGIACMAVLAFMLNGREILTIDGNGVSRRIEAFGIGRTKQWPVGEVGNFRAAGSFLQFDVRGKTIRTGTDLSESSATRIAEQVIARFPELAEKDATGRATLTQPWVP
jgi:hypothetical protein